MASNSKKTSLIRARKARPNKKNQKKYAARVQKNAEILRELAFRFQQLISKAWQLILIL